MRAQVRQALTEYCILPLGSQFIHERAPYIKTLLLYGAEKTGKTLMAQVSDCARGAELACTQHKGGRLGESASEVSGSSNPRSPPPRATRLPGGVPTFPPLPFIFSPHLTASSSASSPGCSCNSLLMHPPPSPPLFCFGPLTPLQSIANLSGANFFDISPRNTDGKYPGKNVAMMIHMVFKVGPRDWARGRRTRGRSMSAPRQHRREHAWPRPYRCRP